MKVALIGFRRGVKLEAILKNQAKIISKINNKKGIKSRIKPRYGKNSTTYSQGKGRNFEDQKFLRVHEIPPGTFGSARWHNKAHEAPRWPWAKDSCKAVRPVSCRRTLYRRITAQGETWFPGDMDYVGINKDSRYQFPSKRWFLVQQVEKDVNIQVVTNCDRNLVIWDWTGKMHRLVLLTFTISLFESVWRYMMQCIWKSFTKISNIVRLLLSRALQDLCFLILNSPSIPHQWEHCRVQPFPQPAVEAGRPLETWEANSLGVV